MILVIARLSLFICSIYGFKWLLQQFLGFDPRIGWITACCLNILILYFGAFAGMLEATANTLAIMGWLLAGYALYRNFRQNQPFRPRIQPPWAPPVAGHRRHLGFCAVAAVRLCQPNGSHWQDGRGRGDPSRGCRTTAQTGVA